jgi:CheY-like chemotaxis protein
MLDASRGTEPGRSENSNFPPGSDPSTWDRVRETAQSIAERIRIAMAPKDFRALRIVVVDDDDDAADSLAAVLEMLGCPTRVCYSGSSTLHVAASDFDPEVYLLDLKMPRMDGFELLKRLKETSKSRPQFYVATTAFGDEEMKRRTKEAGFHIHLTKPIEPATLIEVLTELGKSLNDPRAKPI